MKWTSILTLLICPSLWAQPSGTITIQRNGVTVPVDSVVIHVPSGADWMVSEEVNALLAEQAANWLAQLEEADAARVQIADSLQAELDAVLADHDASLRAFQDTAAALKQTITSMWDLLEQQEAAIDSLDAGWITAFEQGQAIIAHQDSLLNAYAAEMVYWAEVAAQSQAADTVEVVAPDTVGYAVICGGMDLIEAWQAEGAQAERAARLLEDLYPILHAYKEGTP